MRGYCAPGTLEVAGTESSSAAKAKVLTKMNPTKSKRESIAGSYLELSIEPLFGCFGIGADEKNFLHGASARVEAFEAGGSRILDFEGRRRFPAAGFDSARDDAGDVRAVGDDVVENLIEAEDAAVLALDAAEFHCVIIV